MKFPILMIAIVSHSIVPFRAVNPVHVSHRRQVPCEKSKSMLGGNFLSSAFLRSALLS